MTAASPDAAAVTAPARWILDSAADGGIPLTQTHALARAFVQDMVRRFPHLWHSLGGPPRSESEVTPIVELRDALRRLGFVRRRGRKLHATKRGRAIAADPELLLVELARELGAGDRFLEDVAEAVVDVLMPGDPADTDALVRAVAPAIRYRWARSDGSPVEEADLYWTVAAVVRRGCAFGLFEWRPDPSRPDVSWARVTALTEPGRGALAPRAPDAPTSPIPAGGETFVFDAELCNAPGVGALVELGGGQHLTALHEILRQAFGWWEEHLYSFWLDGRFWGAAESELTSPLNIDSAEATAELPVAELDLKPGATIAYIFDFGEEWRVLLTFRERSSADGGAYPRIVEARGTPPPQYDPERS
mgnify:CR=1 FL=1